MITGSTRLAAVIGWPVEHSRSPQMINAAFATANVDAVMVPIGAPPEHFAQVVAGLRAMNALGASVTVPHKLAALALCDQLTPAARDIGAVNCLHVDSGRLVGHNTDATGFADGLVAAGWTKTDARIVLLGAGGAARAVAYGLRDRGTVEAIARRPEAVTWTRARPWTDEQLRATFASADLVVDCTPAGLSTDDDRALADALPIDELRPQAWVSTLIYHRSTSLLERAKERGHSTVDGRAMLVHQGAAAFAIWTASLGVSSVVMPHVVDAMTHALDDALRGT